MSGDRYTSPLGDRRERAVRCRRCSSSTWALDGLCDPCAELELEPPAQLLEGSSS